MTSKILVVEDDDDLRNGIALRLRASGYAVELATDVLRALAAIRSVHPDLVLLDIGLPGPDGFELIELLAHLKMREIPVVVLTGRDPSTAEPVARGYEVAAFLTKPADNQELLRVIEGALQGLPDSAGAAVAPVGR
jgi:DNA-binding response OmpR family regulator